MTRTHVLCIRAAVVLAVATPTFAEIGPVFKVDGLSARYTGTAPLLTVTGTDRPLYWRRPGATDFSPYGANVSFALTATEITWSTPTASLAGSSHATLRVDDALHGLTLLTCEGAGSLHRRGPVTGGPDKASPGLFLMTPRGGTLGARYPFTLTWAEGTVFDQTFVDWTRIYTGTVEAWFYWGVPEPSAAGLCGLGAMLLAVFRVRRRRPIAA